MPKRGGASPIYAVDLWIAGTVGGQLRAAGGTYGAPANDVPFWPGPLGSDARPVDPADCSAYDRIYTVSRDDVRTYTRTGVATPDLREWPWQLGAPVLDGDGDPSTYNLAGGDQPAITGEQTTWWLMNDAGGPHTVAQTPPLGVKVRVEASAFSAASALSQTGLYRYTITNRTAEAIDSAYVGFYIDADLGDGSDDQVGSDTTRSMVYFYNADNEDGAGESQTYGPNPPAVGLQVVSGPVGLPNGRDDDGDGAVDEPGERLRMTASTLICKGSLLVCGEPARGRELAYALRGLLIDGTAFRAYGNGVNQAQGEPTRFAFPGDPVAGTPWSAVNPGQGLPPLGGGDRRGVVSAGPLHLAPGASESVTVAVPFARGADHLDSVRRLRSLASGLREAYAAGALEPRRVDGPTAAAPTLGAAVQISPPAPNPSRDRAAVRYQMPTGTVLQATLLDARGRRVATLFDGPTEAPEGELVVNGAGLAPGVYRVRVVVGAAEQYLTLVRVR